MKMALVGMNAVFFARFNMLKFLMQLTTDKVLFIDFRDPRDFGRLESGREFIQIRLFSRHQQHVALAAPMRNSRFSLYNSSCRLCRTGHRNRVFSDAETRD